MKLAAFFSLVLALTPQRSAEAQPFVVGGKASPASDYPFFWYLVTDTDPEES